MVSLKKSQKVDMTGQKKAKKTAVGDKVKKAVTGQLVQGLVNLCKDIDLVLSEMRSL